MPLLHDELRRQLTERFEREIQFPVSLHFFTQRQSVLSVPAEECPACREAHMLVEEVAALSKNLKLEIHDFVAETGEARRLGVEHISVNGRVGQ